VPLSGLQMDQLAIFLSGADELPGTLYETIFAAGTGFVVRTPGARVDNVRHDRNCIERCGFSHSEALLPYTRRSFQGYRLLQEYFAFPERFLFFRLTQLRSAINALRGKKNVIIIERTDEGLAGDNPLARDIRVAFGKAHEVAKFGGGLPALTPAETPRLFRGAYGIGSRDFRPEHTLGAYEFATGTAARQDGRTAAQGETFFVLGVKDERRGEALGACFVASERIGPAAMRAALAPLLASYKLPRVIVQVEALPMTARGKPDRQAIARMLEQAGRPE